MTLDIDFSQSNIRLPFNSPLESGLRSLCILYSSHPVAIDIQRLVFFDYMLVHSGDAPNGPESLHPATPFRSNEFLVRRHLVSRGLKLMLSRTLIELETNEQGFFFRASESAASYLLALQSPYTLDLRERATWVIETLANFSDADLSDFFNQNLDRWGSEFEIIGGWEAEGER